MPPIIHTSFLRSDGVQQSAEGGGPKPDRAVGFLEALLIKYGMLFAPSPPLPPVSR